VVGRLAKQIKVRHRDHVTGQYLFPACNSCNLTLKMPNRKRKVMQGQVQNKKAKIDGDMEWEEDKYTKKTFFFRWFSII